VYQEKNNYRKDAKGAKTRRAGNGVLQSITLYDSNSNSMNAEARSRRGNVWDPAKMFLLYVHADIQNTRRLRQCLLVFISIVLSFSAALRLCVHAVAAVAAVAIAFNAVASFANPCALCGD
jgi:hypothetical protein